MSEIQKALRVLGLEPGSSKDAIQRRYKRLIFVWHPDRFPTDEGKEDANEELKKINNARDLLFKHFDEGGHRASGCECQATAAGGGASQNKTESDHRQSSRTDEQETEARRRDEERRRRASQAREDYARKQREQEEAKRRSDAQAESLAEAQRKQAAVKDNALRWKIAIAEIAVFVGVLTLGWAGLGVKSWWHDFSWQWQNDHPQQQASPNTDTTTNTGSVPPYSVPPQQSYQNPYINTQPSQNTNQEPAPTYNNATTPSLNTNPPGYNWKPLNSDWKSNNGFGDLHLTPGGTSTTTSTSEPDYSKYLNH